MEYHLSKGHWFYEPKESTVTEDSVTIITEPGTDYWQRTYYGFRNDNGHIFYQPVEDTYFTFSFKVTFDSSAMYDQCGVAIYQDSDNWFKSGIEYHSPESGWLGSVVTNEGYSDWATTEVDASINTIWYRLSRRDSDFLLECSLDNVTYEQMRMFHLKQGSGSVNLGVMACSPTDGSFKAVFSDFKMEECIWKAHEA